MLTSGNTHDITHERVVKGYYKLKGSADKAYFSEENLEFLSDNQNESVIPARGNYTKNYNIHWHVCKERHLKDY